jgi:cell division protein FtsZ
LEDISIRGAKGVLINITGGPSLTLHEVNEAATLIQEEADDDANIIFGAVIDEALEDEISITVIATGFGEEEVARPRETAKPLVNLAAQAARTAAGLRKVVKIGTVVDTDVLDVPTWQRKPRAENGGTEEPTPPPVAANDDKYDIPAFLRKAR